ncbi:ribonuclease R [bacterium]|nr:MAG: ribonuclease R [bacterium]
MKTRRVKLSRRYSSKKRGSTKGNQGRRHRDRILGFLGEESDRPLLARELSDALRVPPKERRSFTRALNSLVNSGAVIRTKGGRHALPSKVHLIVGTIQMNREGTGILISDDRPQRVSVPPANLKSAMHGDKVVVRVEKEDFRGRFTGRVIRIIERGNPDLVAHFDHADSISFGRPYDSRLQDDIIIPPGSEGGALPGQMVVLELTEFPSRGRPARGKVVEVLGHPKDPGSETKAVIHSHHIPHRFPEGVLKIASTFTGPVPRGSLRGREDLRDLPFVTIDGAKARDFDDALYAKRGNDGNITLYVSIADVSHFVRSGSPLDREALRRGNSVYFPDMVVPMLPERLSNDICSLNPDEDRLAFTCQVEVDTRGNPLDYRIYTSVIRSSERLTYRQVEDYFSGPDRASGKREQIIENLDVLGVLFERLYRRRRKRSSLDFDFPEPEVVLDTMGHVENIYRAERYSSHRLVEECMLLANEIVARFIREADAPGVYRIHASPDRGRIEDLNHVLSALGLSIQASSAKSPRPFIRILDEARGTGRERFINSVILRSMMRAEYSPSPQGHFGLALDDYTHFTSPIRRYSDLMVHRILKGLLGLEKQEELKNLDGICEHITDTERTAESAERDILSLYRARFMEDKLGQEYEGFITGVTSFGLFVELKEFFVEGLVHLTTLYDDYYHFRERNLMLVGEHTGRTFRIGDPVKVRVVKVDSGQRHIDFEIT